MGYYQYIIGTLATQISFKNFVWRKAIAFSLAVELFGFRDTAVFQAMIKQTSS